RGTGTTITNDNGLTFVGANLPSAECRANIANCRTILADPFPVRADGTRFDTPLGNALGLMALTGRGITFVDYDWKRARQHRWRLGLQRQLTSSIVVEAAYLGSYTDHIAFFGTTNVTDRLDILPAKYWATGLVRNNALANDLNSTFSNPFNINNFASLATSHPLIYADMRTNGFFTNANISKAQLLRLYPHANGLTNGRAPISE